MEKAIMNATSAASFLGISVPTLNKWCESGHIPKGFTRDGRTWFYLSDLERSGRIVGRSIQADEAAVGKLIMNGKDAAAYLGVSYDTFSSWVCTF